MLLAHPKAILPKGIVECGSGRLRAASPLGFDGSRRREAGATELTIMYPSCCTVKFHKISWLLFRGIVSQTLPAGMLTILSVTWRNFYKGNDKVKVGWLDMPRKVKIR
jgi:hypothetical protein